MEIAQYDLIQKGWHQRLAEPEFIVSMRLLESEARSEKPKDGGGCPSLGGAGHRIRHGPAPGSTDEPAEQFRQASQLLIFSSVEQSFKYARSFCFQTITGEAHRNDGGGVGPKRAVVVRHWIVSRLALSQSSNSPAAEPIPAHEIVCYAAGSLCGRNARE